MTTTAAVSNDVPSVQPVIAHESAGCVMARWKNICIAIWGTQATVTLTAELEKVSEEVIRLYANASTIQLVINKAPLPTADARIALNKLTDRFEDTLCCVATMIGGSGFWAGAMRSFLTGLHLLEQRPFKLRICATPRETSHWLAGPHTAATGVPVDATELERVLKDLLARPSLKLPSAAS